MSYNVLLSVFLFVFFMNELCHLIVTYMWRQIRQLAIFALLLFDVVYSGTVWGIIVYMRCSASNTRNSGKRILSLPLSLDHTDVCVYADCPGSRRIPKRRDDLDYQSLGKLKSTPLIFPY